MGVGGLDAVDGLDLLQDAFRQSLLVLDIHEGKDVGAAPAGVGALDLLDALELAADSAGGAGTDIDEHIGFHRGPPSLQCGYCNAKTGRPVETSTVLAAEVLESGGKKLEARGKRRGQAGRGDGIGHWSLDYARDLRCAECAGSSRCYDFASRLLGDENRRPKSGGRVLDKIFALEVGNEVREGTSLLTAANPLAGDGKVIAVFAGEFGLPPVSGAGLHGVSVAKREKWGQGVGGEKGLAGSEAP